MDTIRIRLLLFFQVLLLASSSSTATNTIISGQTLSGNQTIISEGGSFELGFFRPGKSLNYYIGIWYNKKPAKSPQTVVWVANREKPISNASLSELKISKDGNLVLLNQSKIQIWSSNLTSPAPNSAVAVLLETGNLVLRAGSDSSDVLWQSFDHPTDSWLPRGRVGWNNRTKEYMTLRSWKTPDDPAPGLYSYGMDPDGTDQLVQIWNGTERYWTSGQWNGQFFSSVPEMTRNLVFNYTYFQREKYITLSLFDTKIITRFVASVSGLGIQWAWLNNSADWMLIWSQPRIQCEVYSICGAFSVCDEKGSLLCSCLQGFEPASQGDWDSGYWSGGCVRKTRLQCGGVNESMNGENDKFLVMPTPQLPKDSQKLAVESSEKCQTACLDNCSCTAYSFDGDGGCSIWKGDIRNLRKLSDDNSLGQSVYVRLAASELRTSKSNQGEVAGIIIGVVGGFVIVLSIVLLLAWRRRRKRLVTMSNVPMEGSLVVFRYRDLQILTNNYTERLGTGGFGSVFKGLLPDSTPIAVKKLEGLRQGEKQFRAEVGTMGTIQHVNLVHLIGFCCEGDERLLVYDYMPNGSLGSHLFDDKSNTLDWKTRYQIALGTARGLAYLHEECRQCIIHCDIKPENILLDGNNSPKVGDFGMSKLMGRDFSRVLTSMRGTIGYLAPEWISGLPITPKTDVYSFGMVLFELISGKRNMRQWDEEKFGFFPVWAAQQVVEDEVLCLLDTRLKGNADMKELTRTCRVACWCIQDEESHRPSMGQVVQMLEGVLEFGAPPVPGALRYLLEGQSSSIFCDGSSPSPLLSGKLKPQG